MIISSPVAINATFAGCIAKSMQGVFPCYIFAFFPLYMSREDLTVFFLWREIMAVGGLGFIGYLSIASEFIYGEIGPTTANILIGIISAVIDNIPMMYAVLTMSPDMPEVQWLLVTLTAGVDGSSINVVLIWEDYRLI